MWTRGFNWCNRGLPEPYAQYYSRNATTSDHNKRPHTRSYYASQAVGIILLNGCWSSIALPLPSLSYSYHHALSSLSLLDPNPSCGSNLCHNCASNERCWRRSPHTLPYRGTTNWRTFGELYLYSVAYCKRRTRPAGRPAILVCV